MDIRKKKVVLLGSTGSIGRQTLDVIRSFPESFDVFGLAAGKNSKLLMDQVTEFKPNYFYSENGFTDDVFAERLGMQEMASHPEADLVVMATSGKAGLLPALAAIRSGKALALANKEVMVMAGHLVMKEAAKYGAVILPIDSEHSAIWQCIRGEDAEIDRIILTASGGPFVNYTGKQMECITADEALKHPTWKMGEKVTIDSATLMNKGLETIEAHWLFSVPLEKIEIVVHRQSIIHSLVEFADGSLKAQLSYPDMRFPIQYALTYPNRIVNANLPRLDLTKVKNLTFEKIDYEHFPCLKLALQAGEMGNTYPTVLSAADEIAVELFLHKQIRFTDMVGIVKDTMDQHITSPEFSIESILIADRWARETAMNIGLKRSI